MKKLQTLTFNSAGSQTLEVGTQQIPKRKRAVGIGVKASIPINNTSGGLVTLTDTQKQLLLASILLDMKYGPNLMFQPFIAAGFDRVNREYRNQFGSEYPLYTDATNGLSKPLPNATVTTVQVWMNIPLGRLWSLDSKEAKLMGCGKTQLASMQLKFQFVNLAAVAANILMQGPITLDFYPILEDAVADDPWGKVPHYRENDDTKVEIELVAGLPLKICERTNPNASTTLTSVTTTIGDQEIHNQVSPLDSIQEYLEQPLPPASSITSDRETIIYQPMLSTQSLADLPAGLPKVRQDVKNLATFKWGETFLNADADGDVQAIVEMAARNAKRKIKICDFATHEGVQHSLPPSLTPYLPKVLVDQDAPEFEALPGWVSDQGAPAVLSVPTTLVQQVQGKVAAHRSNGAHHAADRVVQEVQAKIPGGITGTAGPKNNPSSGGRSIRALFPQS